MFASKWVFIVAGMHLAILVAISWFCLGVFYEDYCPLEPVSVFFDWPLRIVSPLLGEQIWFNISLALVHSYLWGFVIVLICSRITNFMDQN